MKQKVMKKLAAIIIAILAGYNGYAAQQERHAANTDTALHYTIKPVPLSDRTNLEITFRFKPGKDSVTATMPQDVYGNPNLYKYITTFNSLNSGRVKKKSQTEKVLYPGSNGEIFIKYVISYNPADFVGASYAPNMSSSFFHLAACQWLLILGDKNEPHHYKVRLTNPPAGWHFYSSASNNPFSFEFSGEYYDVFANYLGGGKQLKKDFYVHGQKLQVFLSGSIQLPQGETIVAVNKIVSQERAWFSDYSFPFYTVTILPRADNVAGLSVPNLFMCYVKEDVSAQKLYRLMAHEMFHTWLGQKISIKLSGTDRSYKYHWFTEGFTEYFALYIQKEMKLITAAEFADAINQYIINVANDRYKNYNYAALTALMDSGKYGTEATKLQYYRGALMALNADRQLQAKGKTLKMFIQQLFKSIKPGEPITEDYLFSFAMKNFGLDLKTPFEQSIVAGKDIDMLPDALGSRYVLKDTTVPAFDIGFSLNESLKNKMITDLEAGGPAERAGIKEGNELVDIENSTRFGNAWEKDKELVVTVKAGGVIKKYKYFPGGKEIGVRLFVEKG